MTNPSVAAIILNWNGWRDTLACLASLARSAYPVQPIVVDNGSADGSVAQLQTAYPELAIVALPANTGYVGGMHAGVEVALAQGVDYLLLINNDTLVDPQMIDHLLHALEQDRGLGLVAPLIYRGTAGTEIWTIGARWEYFRITQVADLPSSPLQPTLPLDVVYGCILLMRVQLWQQLGGFDRRFWAYYEDVDLSLRSRDRGLAVAVVPAAVAWHKVSQSTAARPGRKLFWETQSRLRLFRKRLRPVDFRVFCLLELRYTASQLTRFVRQGNLRSAWYLLQGAVSGLVT